MTVIYDFYMSYPTGRQYLFHALEIQQDDKLTPEGLNNCTSARVYSKLSTDLRYAHAAAPFTSPSFSALPDMQSVPRFPFFLSSLPPPPPSSLFLSLPPCARPGCCRHLIWLPCDRLTGNEEVEGALETGAGVQHSLFGQH